MILMHIYICKCIHNSYYMLLLTQASRSALLSGYFINSFICHVCLNKCMLSFKKCTVHSYSGIDFNLPDATIPAKKKCMN